jgi:hypothetical protein
MSEEAKPVDPVPAPKPEKDKENKITVRKVLKWAGIAIAVIGWAVGAYQALKDGKPLPPPPVDVLPVTQDDLSVPISYENANYHGDIEHIEASGRRWPTNRLSYWIDYPSAAALRPALSNDAIAAAFRQAWLWWSESLEIEPVEVTDRSQALITITFRRMDGPNGVLAESQLANGTLSQKFQNYDSSERWTPGPPANGYLSLPTVACHELGHMLGLGHDDITAPAVMRPTYSASIPREQARDIDRMVQLGYKRRAKSPLPPTDLLQFPVQAKTDDVVEALKKVGFTVTKP